MLLWDQSQDDYDIELSDQRLIDGTLWGTHWHGANRTELLVDPNVELNVGETLDACTTGPGVLCGPCHGAATDGLECRALRTRGCIALTPKVGQQGV